MVGLISAETMYNPGMGNDTKELFPYTPRVTYEKHPLVEVVCQLRFPAILKIESGPPADFQEHLRDSFPLFERTIPFPFPANLPAEIATLMRQQVSPSNTFSSENRSAAVQLGPDAVSLTTKAYPGWDEFRAMMRRVITALNEVYRPSFFTRIGLRYTDSIERGRLGLEGKKWSDLLNREILGELSLPLFEDNVEGAQRALRLKFPDGGGSILMQHGLQRIPPATEDAYVIDLDFYTDQRTEVDRAADILDRFNSRAGRAFRWCITDELHRALRPVEHQGTQSGS